MHQHADACIQALTGLRTMEGIFDAAEAFASAAGFIGMAYVFSPRVQDSSGTIPDPIVRVGRPSHGWTDAWVKYCARVRFHETDLIYRACADTALPLSWRFDPGRGKLVGLDVELGPAQAANFRKCREMTGVDGAVTVPLHSSRGSFGYMSFLTSHHGGAQLGGRQNMPFLLAVGHNVHAAIQRTLPSQGAPAALLNRRETDCLRHLASGRSLEETAEQVGIAYSTVRFHLRAAMGKLGTGSRSHAIAKAAYLGVFGPVK